MATWHAKPRYAYAKDSAEGWDNVQLIYSYLVKHGFSDASACGVIANSVYEGGLNPWRWERDILRTKQESQSEYQPPGWNYAPGYGLCGWTPSAKYTVDNWRGLGIYPSSFNGYGPNYSDETGLETDGHAQCQFIVEGQRYNWVTSGTGRVNVSWSAYREITDPEWAAEVWCRNYEYPQNLETQVAIRRQEVGWFYDRLHGTTPVPDPLDMIMPWIIFLKKAIDNNEPLNGQN